MKFGNKTPERLGLGIILGIGIAAVDSFAFGGEVSPIVIVAMLVAASALVEALLGRRGIAAVLLIWACLPLSHVIKHALGLPDTLHPNTYASILKLAAFSLVVTAIGAGCGAALHTLLQPGKGKT